MTLRIGELQMVGKKIALLLLLVLPAILLVNHVSGNHEVSELVMSGNFEIDEVLLSFRIPGQLLERTVAEGESVASGALIAKLDPAEHLIAVQRASATYEADLAALRELENGPRPEEIEQARAQLQVAQAMQDQLEAGSRPQEKKSAQALLRQAEAQVEKNRAALDEATKDARRVTKLFAENAVSEKDYLAARTREEAANAIYNEAKAKVEAARQSLSIADEGPRREEIARARAAVRAAQAALDLLLAGTRRERIEREQARVAASLAALQQACLQLEYTRLFSPLAGVVLTKAAEAGEFVRQGQGIVTVGSLDRIFLRVYVNETSFGKVKHGQTVGVKVDGFPDETFTGQIVFISQEAEFTPKSVQTHEERVKLVYRIKIAVDNPDHKFKPGMPADAILKL